MRLGVSQLAEICCAVYEFTFAFYITLQYITNKVIEQDGSVKTSLPNRYIVFVVYCVFFSLK